MSVKYKSTNNNGLILQDATLEGLISDFYANRRYKPYSKFPAALRDLAIVVDKKITAYDIECTIKKSAGKYLKYINLFDYYPLNDSKVSYGFNLKFVNDEKTFTDEEINAIQNKIVKNLNKELKAELRS